MQNKQTSESDSLTIDQIILTRKKVVDMYLNSRHYSNMISDEDQIQLKKYEKYQMAFSLGQILFYGGVIGLRYYQSSSKYLNLYRRNIVLQSLSKIPFFTLHAANIVIQIGLNKLYDQYLLEKSLQLISKYDPEANNLSRFNTIIF